MARLCVLYIKGRYTNIIWAWRDKGSIRKEKGKDKREEITKRRKQEKAENCEIKIIIIRRPTSLNTGLFEMIIGDSTTCHTQYTSDRSICISLFNRTIYRTPKRHVTKTWSTGLLNKKNTYNPISSVLCMTSC